MRTSPERRQALLAEFDRSGVSAAVFARTAGIRYQTFAGWLHVRRSGARRQAGSEPGDARPARWLEAVPAGRGGNGRPSADSGGAVRVHLPGGAWLTLTDASSAAAVAALLRALDDTGGASC